MVAKQTLFMETTSIAPAKTVGDISAQLMRAGATEISQQFEKSKIVGVTFTIQRERLTFTYRLPARVEPVFNLINGRRKTSWDRSNKKDRDWEQSERVAWRQVYRWIQAQLAMIETGMVSVHEVFMPYMIAEDGTTIFQGFIEQQLKALPAGKE